jgi:dolichyl-phosphate beta-glucosyltransferase
VSELDLSVVVPAYNEEKRLPRTLERMRGFLDEAGLDYEIIVVDDGSDDDTLEIARHEGTRGGAVRVLANGRNRGKGYSVRRGMLAANGRLVFYSDADLSTPIEEILRLLEFLEDGADIVIGSRGMAQSELEVRQPWYRETMGRIFNWLVRTLVVPGFQDTQCGFKGFRRDCLPEIFRRQRIEKFAFDVEILHIARRLGYRVREIPIRWLDSPQSRVHVMGDSSQMFVDLLRIRWNAWLGTYDENRPGRPLVTGPMPRERE